MVVSEKSPKWLIYFSLFLLFGYSLILFLLANNWRWGFLFSISGLFGFLLKYGNFGFTCSFRTLVTDWNFMQFRDLLLMLFIATGSCSLVSSIKNLHPLFDLTHKENFYDSAQPIGLSLILGSFLFGIGMQLGNGCASGTLVGIGEGFIKSYIVLPFFIIGSTLAITDPVFNWYSKLPVMKNSIQLDFGFILLILMILYFLTFIKDYFFNSINEEEKIGTEFSNMRKLFTIDPLVDNNGDSIQSNYYYSKLNLLFLGIIIGFFYMCVGNMIGVMGVFPKIGATICKYFGLNPNNWNYFKIYGPLPKNFLNNLIFNSDIFIILGAFLASTIKGNFGKSQKNSLIEFIKAIFGGLLMGFGAKFSGGCNIGCMLSGITSSSLHGFVWMFCALFGSFIICKILKYFENNNNLNIYTPIN